MATIFSYRHGDSLLSYDRTQAEDRSFGSLQALEESVRVFQNFMTSSRPQRTSRRCFYVLAFCIGKLNEICRTRYKYFTFV